MRAGYTHVYTHADSKLTQNVPTGLMFELAVIVADYFVEVRGTLRPRLLPPRFTVSPNQALNKGLRRYISSMRKENAELDAWDDEVRDAATRSDLLAVPCLRFVLQLS